MPKFKSVIMKRLLLLIPFLLFFNSALQAQYLPDGAKPVDHSPPREFCFSGIPLLIVDSLKTSLEALILRKDKLEVLEMYSGTEVPDAYRNKADKGLLIAKTVPGTHMLRLADVLDHFEVPAQNRGLRILVNKRLVEDTSLLLADVNSIEKIEIVTLNLALDHVSWSLDADEEYLNISTLSD